MKLFNLFKITKEEEFELTECGFFEKVSYDQYLKDFRKLYGDKIDEDIIKLIYNKIDLPSRSTAGSAGYDFISPFGFTMVQGENIVIPSGIRFVCDKDIYLSLLPRSSTGFKYRVSLANTQAVIDSDYQYADNEGHIMIKLCFDGIEPSLKLNETIVEDSNIYFSTYIPTEETSKRTFEIKQGDKLVQGICNFYGIITDDDAEGKERTGGIGSTGR